MNLFDAAMLGAGSTAEPPEIDINDLTDITGEVLSSKPTQLDGLQGGVPFTEVVVDVNLSEMNLITTPFVDAGGDNVNGMELDPSSGYLFANGTAESEITFVMNNDIPLKPLTTYTLLDPFFYDNPNSDYFIGVEVRLNIYDSNDSCITQYVTSVFDEPTGITFETDTNAVRGEVVVHFEQGCTMTYTNILPILVLGDTIPDDMYADRSPIRGLSLTVWNKNRLTYPYVNGSMFIPTYPDDVNCPVNPHNGLIITDNGDGSITFNGMIPDTIYEELKDDEDALNAFYNAFDDTHGTLYEIMRDIPRKVILPEADWNSESEIKTCTLSGCPFNDELDYSDTWACENANYRLYIRFHHDYDANRGSTYFDVGKGVTINLDDPEIEYASTVSIGVIFKIGEVDNLVFRPQLELGDTVTEYEFPSAKYYTIMPDSSPYTVDTDVYQLDGANEIRATGLGDPKVTVKGVKKNGVVKRIWDKLRALETAINAPTE